MTIGEKKRKHAGNQYVFHCSILVVMFTSVVQQDGDSRDFIQVKAFLLYDTSVTKWTRSQTVNVFITLGNTLFF